MQAAALDIGRNDYNRWKVENFRMIVLGELGIAGAALLAPALIAEGVPLAVTSYLSNPTVYIEAVGGGLMGAHGYEGNLPTAGVSSTGANIGTKLEYVFGKATGNAHNIERSTGMLKQLNSVGIFDNPMGRSLLKSNLENAFRGTEGILQSNGRYLRESLLMGPRGGLKVESVWDNNKGDYIPVGSNFNKIKGNQF